MESTRQNQLLLPAAYAPLSEAEMTYIEGGAFSISQEQIATFTYNATTNLIRLIGQAAIERAFTGLQNMRSDGLSYGGAVKHYWNGQNTYGKLMTGVFVGFAGYAFYVRAMQVINTFLSIYADIKNTYLNDNSASAAGTTTDATAAATAALTAA